MPDGALFRAIPEHVFMATAALVLEIVSPDDETWDKLDFYAAHDVDELLIVDPQSTRSAGSVSVPIATISRS